MYYLELFQLITSNSYAFFLVCALLAAGALFLLLIVLTTVEVMIDCFGKKYEQPFKSWPKKSNENKDEQES